MFSNEGPPGQHAFPYVANPERTQPLQPRRARAPWPLVALAFAAGAAGGGGTGAAAALLLAPHTLPPAVAPAPSPAPTAASAGASAAAATPPPVPANAANVAGAVYSAVGPSVVEITVSGQSRRGGLTPTGTGSGFVIDDQGHILTNNHVVSGSSAATVRFSNGLTRDATIVGTDATNDIALLQVDLPDNIPAAVLGDSDQTQVGETVVAIGSPFGLDHTVTQGIVSAVNRSWRPAGERTRTHLIQTDAPINPGNSGGPLVNARGEVIGINSMIESPIAGSVGIGFAVEINVAKRLIPQLQVGANLEPGWLGIAGQDVDRGALVVSVVPNSPADRAGLRAAPLTADINSGDVVTAVDGKPVRGISDLAATISSHKPGDQVQLSVLRNGSEQQISVTLQAWPTG